MGCMEITYLQIPHRTAQLKHKILIIKHFKENEKVALFGSRRPDDASRLDRRRQGADCNLLARSQCWIGNCGNNNYDYGNRLGV